jgi:hypothetical protein
MAQSGMEKLQESEGPWRTCGWGRVDRPGPGVSIELRAPTLSGVAKKHYFTTTRMNSGEDDGVQSGTSQVGVSYTKIIRPQ